MYKRAILHIGTGKTGTASIQRSAAASRRILAQHGFHYPGPETQHQKLTFAFDPDQSEGWFAQRRGLTVSDLRDLGEKRCKVSRRLLVRGRCQICFCRVSFSAALPQMPSSVCSPI
ncbi:MAG: hypothetical protein ACPGVJ_00675, partial [Mangrovicoccus sp.]